jgi:glycosyltransferase involved in cell wall biosynthesis
LHKPKNYPIHWALSAAGVKPLPLFVEPQPCCGLPAIFQDKHYGFQGMTVVMRVGIVPNLDPSAGGLYQYGLTLLRALYEWKTDDHFVVFSDQIECRVPSIESEGWQLMPLQPPSAPRKALDGLRKIVGEGPHRQAWRWLRGVMSQANATLPNPDVVRYQPEANRWFHTCGIGLMIYPAPTPLSFEAEVPYIMAIHDLQHRLQPEFPEVSANGEWEKREYRYRNGTRYATLLLADSEVGKEDILNFYGPYGVTPDQVKILPFLPACYLASDVSPSERQRVRTIYRLPELYLFYPAQFWPHKNHTRIVQALGLLRQEHGLKIPVVFCGSCTGAIRERIFHEVMSLSARLGVDKEIHYLGYVPDADMSGIYAEAAGLVMPTFFGPTNIPILEAWAFGCPVLTSDIRGIREQVQQGGILVDPRSAEAIAEGIYRLWTDRELGRALADLGRQRLAAYTPEDYRCRLTAIVEEGKERVRAEKPRHAKGVRSIEGVS